MVTCPKCGHQFSIAFNLNIEYVDRCLAFLKVLEKAKEEIFDSPVYHEFIFEAAGKRDWFYSSIALVVPFLKEKGVLSHPSIDQITERGGKFKKYHSPRNLWMVDQKALKNLEKELKDKRTSLVGEKLGKGES